MILDKSGKLIKELDFRGTSLDSLSKISAKDILIITAAALDIVDKTGKEKFKASDLAPKSLEKTAFQPILDSCNGDKKAASKLLGVIIKQALLMSPLLFIQEGSGNDFEGSTYIRA